MALVTNRSIDQLGEIGVDFVDEIVTKQVRLSNLKKLDFLIELSVFLSLLSKAHELAVCENRTCTHCRRNCASVIESHSMSSRNSLRMSRLHGLWPTPLEQLSSHGLSLLP